MHSYLFSHVKRSGNIVAHMLARGAQFILFQMLGWALPLLNWSLCYCWIYPINKDTYLSLKKKKKNPWLRGNFIYSQAYTVSCNLKSHPLKYSLAQSFVLNRFKGSLQVIG
jgi:hypothetical protein